MWPSLPLVYWYVCSVLLSIIYLDCTFCSYWVFKSILCILNNDHIYCIYLFAYVFPPYNSLNIVIWKPNVLNFNEVQILNCIFLRSFFQCFIQSLTKTSIIYKMFHLCYLHKRFHLDYLQNVLCIYTLYLFLLYIWGDFLWKEQMCAWIYFSMWISSFSHTYVEMTV